MKHLLAVWSATVADEFPRAPAAGWDGSRRSGADAEHVPILAPGARLDPEPERYERMGPSEPIVF
jgi:hypothetical protein